MKKTIKRPEVKVMKLQATNVIATSSGDIPTEAKFTMESLTRGNSIGLTWN